MGGYLEMRTPYKHIKTCRTLLINWNDTPFSLEFYWHMELYFEAVRKSLRCTVLAVVRACLIIFIITSLLATQRLQVLLLHVHVQRFQYILQNFPLCHVWVTCACVRPRGLHRWRFWKPVLIYTRDLCLYPALASLAGWWTCLTLSLGLVHLFVL